tara:strand:+ start:3185 stop:3916 length:732 start_codon:yes stop_codon:yes gene_type:complete
MSGTLLPNISYGISNDAWSNVESYIEELIKKTNAHRILEVGAGANPSFSIDFVKKNNLNYSLLDISEDELRKAPDGYSIIVADIASQDLKLNAEYDLIFSRMLAEHIKDGEMFHKNILRLLKTEGIAFHFFPTLYAPPFIINRLLPEKYAEWLLNLLQPGRERSGTHAKFPAYYQWCRGPMESQIKRFEGLGYSVENYIGFFGHSSYYQKLKPLFVIHEYIANWLVKHPKAWITSFAYIILKK